MILNKNFRSTYKEYLVLYKRYLVENHNCELDADLLRLEDRLPITNIVMARQHAKIKVSYLILLLNVLSIY